MKRFLIIAGEYSGDAYGAEIIQELKIMYPNSEFRGMGGDKMAAQGCNLLEHCHNMAFMGFVEVIKHLPDIQKWFGLIRKELKRFKPDAVILIDYPGFNMRVAKMARKQGIATFGFIAPQVWAWKENRIKAIAKDYTHVFGILPFEPEFYSKRGYKSISYVGHPLFEKVQSYIQDRKQIEPDKKIALLPGSRNQELTRLLPIFKTISQFEEFKEYTFIVAGLSRFKNLIETELEGSSNIQFIWDNAYKVIHQCELAIVCSGTATLETALFETPQIIVYKTSRISYMIGKWVAKIKFIGLPNIILNKGVVPELIQENCTVETISKEIRKLLEGKNREEQLMHIRNLKEQLSKRDIFPKIAYTIGEYLGGRVQKVN